MRGPTCNGAKKAPPACRVPLNLRAPARPTLSPEAPFPALCAAAPGRTGTGRPGEDVPHGGETEGGFGTGLRAKLAGNVEAYLARAAELDERGAELAERAVALSGGSATLAAADPRPAEWRLAALAPTEEEGTHAGERLRGELAAAQARLAECEGRLAELRLGLAAAAAKLAEQRARLAATGASLDERSLAEAPPARHLLFTRKARRRPRGEPEGTPGRVGSGRELAERGERAFVGALGRSPLVPARLSTHALGLGAQVV